VKRGVLLFFLAGACGPSDQASTGSAATDSAGVAPSDTVVAMPAFPRAARGRLAALNAGVRGTPEIKGEWPAEAGTCDQPPMLQLVAQQPGMGTIILLALPPANRLTRYPVTIAPGGLPTLPAAQVGVNLFRSLGTFAYQAADGEVLVYALDRVVSGRFAVTLREINTNVRVKYAGTFREVPVKPLDAEQCAMADSVAAR